MKTVLPFFVTIFHITNTLAYNLATDYYVVYTNPKVDKNLFGLSVVLHGGRNVNESWVQIGAPARIATGSQRSLVYRCNMRKPCTPLNFDKSTFKGDGWLGSVMDINLVNNSTVVCEPLAKKKYSNKFLSHELFVIGSCYVVDFNGQVTEIITPLDQPDSMYYDAVKRLPYFYGLGEFGFSARFTTNREMTLLTTNFFNNVFQKSEANLKQLLLFSDAEIIFGAPGVLNWIGHPLKYRNHTAILGQTSDFVRSKQSFLRSHSYVGYSTTAGHFSNSCGYCYAYGAPRAADAKGTVVILNHAFELKQLLIGEQMGEYFGGTLAAGDINADGFDDLIVGSPSYQTSSYSEGCIHVFLGTFKKLSRGQSICGSKQGAHFGTAISYLLDLDWDGYGDVAVGAPYEDNGRGVVYIYNGSPIGLLSKPSQVIAGRIVYDHLRGFGYSISNYADVDGNGYNDLAIGAYRSGHVVVVQGKPIVTINQTMKSLNVLNSTSKYLHVEACFKYEAKNFNRTIRISTVVSVEEIGVSIERDLPRNISIQQYRQKCENLRLKLNRNKYTNIHLRLNSTIINRATIPTTLIIHEKETNSTIHPSLCKDCVINNRTHSAVLDLYIPFNLHCKNTTVCYANFSTSSSWLDVRKNTIIIGTRKSVSLTINATNTGENAYLAKIDVEIPQYVQFGMIPSMCELSDNVLSCDVGDLLENTTKIALNQLEFDLETIIKGVFVDDLKITVTARTESKNLANNVEVVPLKLLYAGTINITKQISDNMGIVYDKDSKALLFTNVYKIDNMGPSPVATLTLKFLVPTAIQNKHNTFLRIVSLDDLSENSNFKCAIDSSGSKHSGNHSKYVEINRPYELNFTNRTFVLDCTQENIFCTEISCNIGPLVELDSVIVPLQMNFTASTLVDFMDDKNIIVIAVDSSISVKEPKTYMLLGNSRSAVRTYNVVTGETQKNSVEMWIIVASMVIGLILLVLLTVALGKMGFFERTKKKQLEHEKEVLAENDFYGYLEGIPSVQREFINPNGLLRGCDDN